MHVAVLKEWIRELSGRNKNILGSIIIRALKIKVRRQDANHSVGYAIHGDSLSHDVGRCAKLALPQARAEDCDRRSAESVFFWREQASTGWSYAENFKESGRNHGNAHAFWLSPSRDTEIVAAIGGDGRKCGIGALPIQEIRIRNRGSLEIRCFL